MNYAVPRIVLADDHPLVLSALKATLGQILPKSEIITCETVECVMQITAQYCGEIDLVLLDLDMPESNGFESLFTLFREFPNLPIAIISATQSSNIVHRALSYGAAGYIWKSMSLPEMQEAVLLMLEGRRFIPPGITSDLNCGEDLELARRFLALTSQQRRILAMIVEGKLNKQIGAELSIAEQTVKIHVSTIFKKLHVQTRTQAAVLAERFYPKIAPENGFSLSRLR